MVTRGAGLVWSYIAEAKRLGGDGAVDDVWIDSARRCLDILSTELEETMGRDVQEDPPSHARARDDAASVNQNAPCTAAQELLLGLTAIIGTAGAIGTSVRRFGLLAATQACVNALHRTENALEAMQTRLRESAQKTRSLQDKVDQLTRTVSQVTRQRNEAVDYLEVVRASDVDFRDEETK